MIVSAKAPCPNCDKKAGLFVELKPKYHKIALTVKVRIGFICMACGTYANGGCETTLACYKQGWGRVVRTIIVKIADSLKENKPKEEEEEEEESETDEQT